MTTLHEPGLSPIQMHDLEVLAIVKHAELVERIEALENRIRKMLPNAPLRHDTAEGKHGPTK